MADSRDTATQPTQGPTRRLVFIDRDVAWSPAMRDLLLHCEGSGGGPIQVLWSGNSTMDPYDIGGLRYGEAQQSALEKLTEVPGEARRRLQPLTSAELRDPFPHGEVREPNGDPREAFNRADVPLKFQEQDLGHPYCVWQDMLAAVRWQEAARGRKVGRSDIALLSHNPRHLALQPAASDYESAYDARRPPWRPTSFGDFMCEMLDRDPEATITQIRRYADSFPLAIKTTDPDALLTNALAALDRTHASGTDRFEAALRAAIAPEPTGLAGKTRTAMRTVGTRLGWLSGRRGTGGGTTRRP